MITDSAVSKLYDCIMHHYEKSEVRLQEQDKIAEDIESFGNLPLADNRRQLVDILARINYSDSHAYIICISRG